MNIGPMSYMRTENRPCWNKEEDYIKVMKRTPCNDIKT